MNLSPQAINVLNFVRESAEKFGSPKRIILFGSRARHDHGSRSDYDIAVEPDPVLNRNWALFWNLVDEAAPTLCRIDLINLADDLSESFRVQIESAGIDFNLKAGNHETK
jgi:predicted nucleotidyltransferase